MQTDYPWSIALQIGQPLGIEAAYMAHGVVGTFAAVLFLFSLYAWSRRRHVGLLLVSIAFLVFCLKEVLWVLSEMYSFNPATTDLITAVTDLAVLGLFFVAITLRPRKQLG